MTGPQKYVNKHQTSGGMTGCLGFLFWKKLWIEFGVKKMGGILKAPKRTVANDEGL